MNIDKISVVVCAHASSFEAEVKVDITRLVAVGSTSAASSTFKFTNGDLAHILAS